MVVPVPIGCTVALFGFDLRWRVVTDWDRRGIFWDRVLFSQVHIAELDKGDVLLVTRLDRLARSTRDLLNLLGAVAEKGAGFKSLRDTWADTTTAHGRLMLTVLGGLAESC